MKKGYVICTIAVVLVVILGNMIGYADEVRPDYETGEVILPGMDRPLYTYKEECVPDEDTARKIAEAVYDALIRTEGDLRQILYIEDRHFEWRIHFSDSEKEDEYSITIRKGNGLIILSLPDHMHDVEYFGDVVPNEETAYTIATAIFTASGYYKEDDPMQISYIKYDHVYNAWVIIFKDYPFVTNMLGGTVEMMIQKDNGMVLSLCLGE